ncbi:MAG: hypothetical protein ACWGOX_08110 [Desulforhopalus sp.]
MLVEGRVLVSKSSFSLVKEPRTVMSFAKCHPILIGSLPLRDHKEALQLIMAYVPQLPLWPQLPRNPKEGMIRQFLSGFPGLVDQNDRHWIDTARNSFEEEMAAFYEDFIGIEQQPQLLEKSRFSLDTDTAAGFFTLTEYLHSVSSVAITVKGQITGPITTGIATRDQLGNSIIYDDNLRDILVKLLALKGRWQVAQLRKFTDRIPPVIFIDEPGLVSFGSCGFGGISREMVSESVNLVISAIQEEGGLAGVHICANGDWGPALVSKADIISFDAYFYFDNFILYREQLHRYIARGGILAWGIIPTGDPQAVERESSESLFNKWQKQLQTLSTFGFTEQQLMEQILIAPSCGTGSLSPPQAEKVLAMTAEVSRLARDSMSNTA